jgi:hypothetical protein
MLYRDHNMVDPEFFTLLRSQSIRGQEVRIDFKRLSHAELLESLKNLATTRYEMGGLPDYILALDNFLKMTLIMLRIRAKVPVILMGETGCGKTSLIHFLAAVAGVKFECLNVHAGTSIEDIVGFVDRVEEAATGSEVWAFLDEINTCEHLGVISNLICNNKIMHRHISCNVTFAAACNPYKLRRGSILTPGLSTKAQKDVMSALMYRVHPLPERLVDYVMDFGALDPADERLYIDQMCSFAGATNREKLVGSIVMSQAFIKEHHSCASLRDVKRAITLIHWFTNHITGRTALHKHARSISQEECHLRAVLATFSICYRARLTTSELRERYTDRKSTRLNSSHNRSCIISRMPSSA